MQQKLENLKQEVINKIKNIKLAKELEDLKVEYLGRKGKLTKIFKDVKNITDEEKPVIGRLIQEVKSEIKKVYNETSEVISRKEKGEKRKGEYYDITLPGIDQKVGTLHPVTQVKNDLNDAFKFLGFEIYQGPEITSEGYAFDNLNFPADHPARESMDTYWIKFPISNESFAFIPQNCGMSAEPPQFPNKPQIKNSKLQNKEQEKTGMKKLCLRPHLTGASIRYMQTHKPPFRFVYPGRAFRSEATDAGHERCFYQYEALIVNEDISFSGGKILINTILERVFGKKVKIRMRPGFFSFVEPGFEIDMQCLNCKGKGCPVCKHSGWVEMMPGGPPHPNVFKVGNIDREKWQGFYINIGLDRLTMMKYGIDDIRLIHSGDLRFLKQFH